MNWVYKGRELWCGLISPLARVAWRRTLVVPLAALTWLALAAAGQVSASASTPGEQGSAVSWASAWPTDLGASGGTVAVTGTVERATTCQLEFLSSQSFPVVYSHNPKTCSAGSYSARVTIGPNPSAVQRTVAFALVARNQASASAGRFYLLLAGGHRAPAGPGSLPANKRPASTSTPPASTAAASTAAASTPPATTTVPATTAPAVSLTNDQSSNWSGYVVGDGPYSVAKGTFTVPAPSPGRPAAVRSPSGWASTGPAIATRR